MDEQFGKFNVVAAIVSGMQEDLDRSGINLNCCENLYPGYVCRLISLNISKFMQILEAVFSLNIRRPGEN